MKITKQAIASALAQFRFTDFHDPKDLCKQSHKLKNNVWNKVVESMFGRKVVKSTLKKYSLRCRIYFYKHFNNVSNLILAADKENHVEKTYPKKNNNKVENHRHEDVKNTCSFEKKHCEEETSNHRLKDELTNYLSPTHTSVEEFESDCDKYYCNESPVSTSPLIDHQSSSKELSEDKYVDKSLLEISNTHTVKEDSEMLTTTASDISEKKALRNFKCDSSSQSSNHRLKDELTNYLSPTHTSVEEFESDCDKYYSNESPVSTSPLFDHQSSSKELSKDKYVNKSLLEISNTHTVKEDSEMLTTTASDISEKKALRNFKCDSSSQSSNHRLKDELANDPQNLSPTYTSVEEFESDCDQHYSNDSPVLTSPLIDHQSSYIELPEDEYVDKSRLNTHTVEEDSEMLTTTDISEKKALRNFKCDSSSQSSNHRLKDELTNYLSPTHTSVEEFESDCDQHYSNDSPVLTSPLIDHQSSYKELPEDEYVDKSRLNTHTVEEDSEMLTTTDISEKKALRNFKCDSSSQSSNHRLKDELTNYLSPTHTSVEEFESDCDQHYSNDSPVLTSPLIDHQSSYKEPPEDEYVDKSRLNTHTVEEDSEMLTTTDINEKKGLRNLSKNAKKLTANIVLPQQFWTTYFQGNNTKLKRGWSDAFNMQFEKVFPECTLVVRWHKFTGVSSKNGKTFIVFAECKHSNCRYFYFTCSENITAPFTDHSISVSSNKLQFDHNPGECHSRFVKNQMRRELNGELEKTNALSLRLDKINSADKSSLRAGNLNAVPSLNVMQKIMSEDRKKMDLDTDFNNFMRKLIIAYNELLWYDTIPGFIQQYCLYPFSVTLFSESQLRCLLAEKERFVYLDATGSVIAQPMQIEKHLTLYYYAMILAGNSQAGPVPIFEHISANHDVFHLKAGINLVHEALTKLSQKKLIHKIETDFSLGLLQASCQVFNGIDIYEYINKLYMQFEDNVPLQNDYTILHICSTHLINTVRKKLNKCFTDKKKQSLQRQVALSLLSNMIHSCTIKEIYEDFTKLILLYSSEKKSKDFNEIIKCIKNSNNIKETEEDEENEEDNVSGRDFENNDEKGVKSSLYYKHFLRIKESTLLNLETEEEDNLFYNEAFSSYLIEFLMVYFPIWSASSIKPFGILRDSTSAVENHFKIYKWQLLRGKRFIPLPRFIMLSQKYTDARLTERSTMLHTTRSRMHKKKTKKEVDVKDEIEIEVWMDKKRKKRKENVYFRQSKYVQNITLKDILSTDDDLKTTTINCDAENSLSKKEADCLTENKNMMPTKTISNNEEQNENFMVIDNLKLENSNKNNTESVLFNKNIDYPQNFPECSRTVGGLVLSQKDFETLKPYKDKNQYLNDNIINAFFSLLPIAADDKNFKFVVFDTFFIEKLKVNRHASFGFENWAKMEKVWMKDLWLIPVNHNNYHWTLMIVIVKKKIIMHIDSLHGKNLDEDIINGICNFIQSGTQQIINWDEWTLYTPKDNPSQILNDDAGGDCGVHVAVWAYIISTGSMYVFSQHNMETARRGISNFLLNTKITQLQSKRKERLRTKLLDATNDEKQEFKYVFSFLKKTSETVLGFENIFDLCASLKIIITSEISEAVRRQRT